jgi:hypothetical protein
VRLFRTARLIANASGRPRTDASSAWMALRSICLGSLNPATCTNCRSRSALSISGSGCTRRMNGTCIESSSRATASFASTMNISMSVWVKLWSSGTASTTLPSSSSTSSTSGRSSTSCPCACRRFWRRLASSFICCSRTTTVCG